MVYDTIIIGMGPAGLQAGLYTARANLKTLIIGDPEKSQLWKAHVVENYFSIMTETGPKMMEIGVQQVQKFGAELLRGEEVVNVEQKEDGTFWVKTASAKEFFGKTAVLATGMAYKVGGIKNEDALAGKGVHYCVTCDGAFYNGKKLAVIGKGNFAAEEAIGLLSYTKDVTIIAHAPQFELSSEMDTALSRANIQRVTGKVASLVGTQSLETVMMVSGEQLPFDGVFMGIGMASALSFASKLGIAMDGTVVKANRDGRTNIPNLYAAGACTGGNAQLAKEVGEGCNAAMHIIKTLLGRAVYIDYEKA